MIRTDKGRKALCAVLLMCILLFIWGNSLLDAEESGRFSQWLRDLLGMATGELPGQSDGVLRKIAHFVEFCALGFLLSWQIAMRKERKQAFVLPAAALGCLVACLDEMLQHFSPGRASRFTDVAIDTAGVLVGIGLLSLGHAIKRKNINLHFGGKQQ